MRRAGARLALVLAVALAGAAAWDGSQRRPLEGESGSSLSGLPRGRAPGAESLTVVQFNIHRGAPAEGESDLDRTDDCLEGADLAGLNEVAGADWLSGAPDQAEALGESLGLAWLFVPSERRWWQAHFGNGLLSALPARDWQRVPLPHEKAKSYRTRLEATLDWLGQPVTVVVTHLDAGPDRDLQLAELATRFAALPAPKILLGDLNTRPDNPVIAAWLADPALAVTSGQDPGASPGGVDWIVTQGFEVARAWRCDNGASDHPAVGAELRRRF
jgi:endonuclease/exonuclease/phosphatase family metal-dependent hydrolase